MARHSVLMLGNRTQEIVKGLAAALNLLAEKNLHDKVEIEWYDRTGKTPE